MSRSLAVLLCALTVFAVVAPAASASSSAAPAQVSSNVVEPLRVPAGTVLAFHLQTRLRHSALDPLDLLPAGTVVHVRILNPIDSTVDRDGSEFHGLVVADISTGSGVVIHSEAEVQGLLVLLRSRNHPDGFRYELILTLLTDHGNSYPLTASLNTSFFDSSAQPAPAVSTAAKLDAKQPAKPIAPSATKTSLDTRQ